MGAFMLAKNPSGLGSEQLDKLHEGSLRVFQKKGLALNRRIEFKNYVLYTFHKNKLRVENTVVFDDGQFIVGTGTLIYKRKTGREALIELFEDFSPQQNYLSDILGQYALIVFKNGELHISNDYTGYYHIYTNQQKTLVSNSFLAILKSIPQGTISDQELFEYVVGGSCFGGKTMIKEIEMLDRKGIFRLFPDIKLLSGPPAVRPYIKRMESPGSLEKSAQRLAGDLIDYFAVLKANFGETISSPLTGGVHTRLMLGCMKRVGIKPVYMYIFGDPQNKTGRDANAFPIAKSIADAEGLPLEFLDTTVEHRIELEKYPESIEQTYYLGDGLAHEVGIFHKSFNPELRLKRAEKACLILNGAGGETFRNYWVLPDRPYHIDSFIKSRFDSADTSIFAGNFNPEAYFGVYREKMKQSLNTEYDMLSRKQIELVQPDFENRYWMGNNNSINSQISHYLTPFADAQITYQACDVPLSYKEFSLFESAMMRAIDINLAKYPTAQGVDMLHNKMRFKDKANYTARRHIPIWLKAFLRKRFYDGAGEHLSLNGNKLQLPYTLSEPYLQQIFPDKTLTIEEFFQLKNINNPAVLSRALTAELIINNRL